MPRTWITALSLLVVLGGTAANAQDEGAEAAAEMSAAVDEQSPVPMSDAVPRSAASCLGAPEATSTMLGMRSERPAGLGSDTTAGAGGQGGTCLSVASATLTEVAESLDVADTEDVIVPDTAIIFEDGVDDTVVKPVNDGAGRIGSLDERRAQVSPPAKLAPAPSVSARRPKSPQRSAPVEPLKAWWPNVTAGALNVLFAGEASFGSAIAMVFDGEFENAASANRHIRVSRSDGTGVKGEWVLASNPKMLLFQAEPGIYVLGVQEGLAAKDDRKVAAPSGGTVFLR